jgi:dTDP-4-amino-4,6-dideoxy-D-galactose acyltransferase
MNNTQHLAWDSHILGLSVAKILATPLNSEELQQLLQKLKDQGVKLVYWLISNKDSISQKAAQYCNGFLADEKVTYCLDLTTLSPLPKDKSSEIYTDDTANTKLEAIAIEIGKLSRFGRDPHLTPHQVNKLYKEWINNACKKRVAKVVLVIKEQQTITGMVTIDEKQSRADLSLLGVDPQHQGQGLGKHLVRAAQVWSLDHGYRISQVVTQKTNVKACHLYESCSYQLEKTESFYHFWL